MREFISAVFSTCVNWQEPTCESVWPAVNERQKIDGGEKGTLPKQEKWPFGTKLKESLFH